MVTLKDVARVAGVTKMTVSNVLNGRTGQVSEQTSRRVMQAVKELGYERNAAARALSAARSGIVVFIYPGPNSRQFGFGNPHDSLLLHAVEQRISEAGKHLMVHSSVDDVMVTARQIGAWNADGAIFFGILADQVSELRAVNDVPMVFIDAVGPDPVATVGLDDKAGAYLATKHLLSAGHRRIAFVGPLAHTGGVIQDRLAGFEQAMSEAPGTVKAAFHSETTYSNASSIAPTILADPRRFTAAVTTADTIAVGLLRTAQMAGLHVPDDFSLVGFDDILLAEMTAPPLTSVRQDVLEKGRRAADLLLSQLANGQTTERVVLTPSLTVRESVAPPRDRKLVPTPDP
ncbi:LacI family DNA-binding transcriptional regulator [Tessaracoccus caeni]|uniref:LacI family DNA-binding transcriptional regulator n=1 Tax=Tessaracoccus caeni TaxID=3031239 RepID=UPI0023DA1650|nr:LacI family DNA-binding transcriptional regulator [Tessaracoccus caeni]MDF1489583.1 LacI family DNA-binding transcriptional regulator [Tessaracoccus caeni]